MKYWLNCSTRQAGKLSFEVQLWLFFTANKQPLTAPASDTGLGTFPNFAAGISWWQAGTRLLISAQCYHLNYTQCLWGFRCQRFFFPSAASFLSFTPLAPALLHFQMPFPWKIQIAISFTVFLFVFFFCDLWISWISGTIFVGMLERIKQ